MAFWVSPNTTVEIWFWNDGKLNGGKEVIRGTLQGGTEPTVMDEKELKPPFDACKPGYMEGFFCLSMLQLV